MAEAVDFDLLADFDALAVGDDDALLDHLLATYDDEPRGRECPLCAGGLVKTSTGWVARHENRACPVRFIVRDARGVRCVASDRRAKDKTPEPLEQRRGRGRLLAELGDALSPRCAAGATTGGTVNRGGRSPAADCDA